jgi:hypothetical protein
VNGLGSAVGRVTSGVDRLGRRAELTAQLRRIDMVDKAADPLLDQLSDLAKVLAVARSAGFAPPMPDSATTAAAVEALCEQLAGSDVDGEFAQEVIDSIETLVRVANESLSAAWHAYVVERVPSQEGLVVLAQVFSEVEGAGTDAMHLRASTQLVQSYLQQVPSADAISKLDSLAHEIPQLLQRLVGEQSEVREFADQLARGGAAIESLTPSVLKWMKERGFETSFKVVPGSPAERES